MVSTGVITVLHGYTHRGPRFDYISHTPLVKLALSHLQGYCKVVDRLSFTPDVSSVCTYAGAMPLVTACCKKAGHGRAFVQKDAEIAFGFGQVQGTLKGGQGLRVQLTPHAQCAKMVTGTTAS